MECNQNLMSGDPERVGGLVGEVVRKMGGDSRSGTDEEGRTGEYGPRREDQGGDGERDGRGYDSKGQAGEIYKTFVKKLGGISAASWARAESAFEMQGEALTVSVPSEFFAQYLGNNYGDMLDAAVQEVLEKPMPIGYKVIGQEEYDNLKITAEVSEGRGGQMQLVEKTTKPPPKPSRPFYILSPRSPEFIKMRANLPIPYPEHANGKNFVMHPGNEIAVGVLLEILKDLKNGKRSEGPILLQGGQGVGKTLILARAMYRAQMAGILSGYVDVEQVAQFAGREKAFPEVFRYLEKEKVRLLVVDGIEGFNKDSRPGTERKIDTTIRSFISRGGQVLLGYAGGNLEAVISRVRGGEHPNLGSTLEEAANFMVSAPDKDGQKEIVKATFRLHGLGATKGESLEQIAEDVARQFPGGSSAKYIVGKAKTVARTADASGRDLSRKLVKRVLYGGVQARIDFKDLTPEDIIQRVAARYEIKASDIIGGRRDGSLPTARGCAAIIMRELLGITNREIGEGLGGMDPSSITAAIKRVGKAGGRNEIMDWWNLIEK